VAGVPHAEWGQVPVAWVVCDGPLDVESLLAWCRTQMASFKAPREVRVVDSLPRNAMGKVQKNLLT
jgi:acyl-CoA synthetase (AMP-forming)/AMP-acid ligase II